MSSDVIHPHFQLSRRALLRAFTVSAILFLQACTMPTRTGENTASTSEFLPDVEIKITARQGSTQILPGASTNTWSYHGEVLKGDANAVINLAETYLGPILRLRKGQKVRIHLQNELPEATIIHWHGLIVPPKPMVTPAMQSLVERVIFTSLK